MASQDVFTVGRGRPSTHNSPSPLKYYSRDCNCKRKVLVFCTPGSGLSELGGAKQQP